jgi:hypothetical protein
MEIDGKRTKPAALQQQTLHQSIKIVDNSNIASNNTTPFTPTAAIPPEQDVNSSKMTLVWNRGPLLSHVNDARRKLKIRI